MQLNQTRIGIRLAASRASAESVARITAEMGDLSSEL